MSSFKDLVKKVNNGQYKTVSASGQKQSSHDEEEKKETESSFKSLVKRVNDGTIKVGTSLKDEDITSWYNSVDTIRKSAYDYLSREGYKEADTDILSNIETHLAQANDVGQYFRANRSSISNYDELMQGYYDTVSYLRNIQSSIKSSNSFYSQWDTADQYNFWKDHSTVENRQEWYAGQQGRLEELKKERDSVYDSLDNMSPSAYGGVDSYEYQKAQQDYISRYQEIEDEITAVETEMRNYERGNYNADGQYYGSKVVDDYSAYSKLPDFVETSVSRDFSNPTRDQLAEYDVLNDSSTWYRDANGVYRDAFGNELVVDASGHWVNPKAQEKPVKDRLGMFLRASEDELQEAIGTPINMEGTWASVLKDGVDGSWDQLTGNEVDIYYYLLNTSGQETADKYLSDMKTELNRRETAAANQRYVEGYSEANFLEKILLNVATVPANLVGGLAGTIENTANILMGNEINPYSAAQSGANFSNTIRSETAKDIDEATGGFAIPFLDFSLGDAYQSGMSILDSYASIGIGGKFGGALLATSAANSEATRLYEQGASMSQIAWGSAAAGAAEMVFESVSIDKLINMKDAKTVGQWVKNALIQGGIEASEEGFTEIANVITNSIIMGNQSDWARLVEQYDGDTLQAFLSKVRDVANASLGGFLSGTGSGSIPSAISYGATQAKYANAGKAINYADGRVDALLSLAKEVAGVSEGSTQKELNRDIASVSKKATNRRVGRLYDTVKTANNLANASANQADIAKSLTRKGFNSETANDIAEALVARNTGQELTKAQTKLLESVENNKVVKAAISNIISNTQSTMGQRSQNIRDFDQGVSKGIITKALGVDTKAVQKAVEKQFTPEGTYETSVEGKTIRTDTGDVVEIKGIASIKDGEMLLDIGDGNTINAKEVSYASKEQALVYEAIANIGDRIDADTANKLFKQYKGGNAMAFARGIAQAYDYGYYGVDISELTGENSLATELTQEQRNYAYNQGSRYRNVKDQADKAKARASSVAQAAGKKGVYYRSKDGTVTDFRSYEKDSGVTLKDVQRTAIDVMERMSKIMGVRFNVFESWVENGKRYYLDENGVKTEGNPNGFYDPKTGEIYIDLEAGNGYEGVMLFTVAHELTHFMRQWSPEHFTKIARIVFKHGGMKGNVSALVAAKQAKAKAKGKPISYDTAMEEAVADGMETILKDGKVVEFMADVKQTDHAAWEKIKEWFKDLAKLLRDVVNAYIGHSAQTSEGAKVAAFAKDLLQQIEKIYAEGAVAAGENYQAAMENVVEKNAEAVSTDEIITDGAVVTDGEGTKFSIKSMKHDIAEGQMFEDLKTYCGWTQKQVNELRQNLNDLVEYMTPFRDILDMNESYGREGRRFSPYKPNSDPLYKISMDFSTLCSKRLLTQYVIENLQLRENRPMTAEEQMAIRDMLNEYRKVEKGLQVACAMCYVEAARLKSPQQINKWLADPETQMRNFFADKDPEFAAFIKEKQADFKESRGYARNATKKDMSAKDVRDLNKIRPRLRSQYQVSAEEAKIIARAKELPNSTYLTAGNLADLSESDPVIYSAYTAFVRTATRSKSLETDEPYYYGDSRRDNGNGIIVSDSFIEAVNRENGMRFSSWSDWRIQHLLDYITAVIDNSVRGAAMHGYTKFGEEVRVLGKTGMMFNMSGVAGTQTGLNEDGSLSFSSTESMDVNEAIQLREEFPETAGLQCIGVSDAHIIALLRSDIIDYIIPYHISGLNAALRRMADIYGWDDYTGSQHAAIDNSIKFENAVDQEHWHEEPVWSEFFVGYNTGMTGIEAMRASADRYVQLCKDRGLKPKFEQFLKEENYWKLLIDRKMINQKTGKLIQQKAVTPTFDFGTIKEVVDRYVQNYDSGLEARALNHIVENWDSIPKRIKDLKKQGGTKAKKTSKAVDTLANETLAAQPTTKMSGRDIPEGLSPAKYNALLTRKPIQASKKDWAKVNQARMSKYSQLEDGEIPDLDIFRLAEYGKVNEGYLYFVRNSGKDNFVIVGKKQIVPAKRYVIREEQIAYEESNSGKKTHPYDDRDGSGRRTDAGDSERSGDRSELRENDSGTGSNEKPVQNSDTWDGTSDSRSGIKRSDRDSDGNSLTAEQSAFFAHSKVRDDKGRLIPMYHGTNTPNFTVFDPQMSDDHISLFFTSDPDVANTYTNLQDKGRDVDPYNLITALSSAEQFNAAQERVGGGLRVVKITPEWIQEMKTKAEKSSTRLLGVANKYADLLESINESGVFNYDIERIREVTGNGTRILKESEISKLRSAMGSAKDHLFFVKDKRTREISRIYSDTYKLFDEARNYAHAAATTDGETGAYTYTETNSSVPFRLGSLLPGTEKGMVAQAIDRMKWVEEHHLGNRYKVYLNITNPYIQDAGKDYSGMKKKVSLEYDYREEEWTVDMDGDTFVFHSDEFDDFALNAFDNKTYGEINAKIQDDIDNDSSGLDDDSYGRYVDHYIRLKNVSVSYVAPGNWNALNFNGNENARTRDVAAWAKENGYDGVIFKNMKDAGGYAFMKGRGGSTVATAFSSEQVKSVDNKNPTADPDIRFSDRDGASNENSPAYTGEYPSGVKFQHREDNPTTLKMLNDQVERGEYTTVYKALLKIGDTYYPPMASLEKDENGRYTKLRGGQKLFDWIASDGKLTEEMKAKMKMKSPKAWLNKYADAFKDGRNPWGMYGDFNLKKADESGKSQGAVPAAYNPYQHSSDQVLNDQFEAAYDRPGLVVVECRIPNSELTKPYWAPYAKDPTGMHEWKTGPIAGQLKKTTRHVYMTRWIQPIRELSASEVAQKIRDIVAKEDTPPRVYWNTISPKVLPELIKLGVEIDPYGSPNHMNSENAVDMYGNKITDEIREERKAEKEAKKAPKKSKKASKQDTLYSDRDTESVSNRSLLANAFEGLAQNEIERNKIQEYKSKVSLANAEERKLHELNEKIKELSFAKGPKDTKAIRDLQFEARQTANRISTYDKILLRLEASKPLQDVLTREKEMVRKREKQKGKEALEAYREKTMKTQRELIEKWQESRKKGVDSRNRTAMRHKIKDIVNELNQYLLHGSKDRHVPIELQKAVAEALDAVNMDTVGAEERIAKLQDELMKAKTPEKIQEISRKIDHVREMGDKMNGRLQKLKDAYDQFVNSDDPMIANSHDEVISNKLQSVIDSIGNTPLRDMTVAQLEDVYDMYRMVLTTIRNANKAFKDKKKQSISALANRVMEEIDTLGGKKKLSLAMLNGIKKFGWNNLKPVYAFEHIGSDTFTEVFNNVRAGEDVWAVDVTEAREFYLDKSKKHGYDSWDLKKRYMFKSTSGMDFSLDLEQIMSLYAYSKRDQAADHLKKGGIVFDESTKIVKKTKLGLSLEFNPTEATAYNISEPTLAEIISKLTDEQKVFVDEMQDYLSTVMGAKGNEVSLEMYGIKLFKEKFYFPLKSAQQFMAKAKEQQKGEVKIKNSGFSKETVQKASNPIVLTPFMNVWSDHVNEMSMYHAFVLPMEDFYRVYNYKTPTSETMATESVEMFIQNAYGKGATGYIDQLLKDLNGGARTDNTTGIINKMMGLFKKGAVFASLSVVVQQPSAIARAAALVDTKYFIGPKVDHKTHKLLWDEVKHYAPVAIIKEMGYFDTNMGKSTHDFITGKEYSGFKEKMKALVTDSNYRDELLSKAPALADEIAWCSIWEAVKRETQAKNPGMDVKSEAFLKMAGERFTEVIVKTQVYDSVLSRSGLMRSKDTGMKMATAFMAEPTTSINMIADALLKGKRGNKKYARSAIGAVIASQILNSILVSFVYAGRDDDEDETYLEKYIGTLTAELLDSLNPAGYIPFIKDIMSIVQGYDVERSDMAIISDLWNAWENLSKDNVSAYRKVEGFAGSIAQIFGLPVKNIMRDVRGIYQTIDSFVNGEQTTAAGIGYAIKGSVTGKDVSDEQQLYEAMLNGDKEQIARVKARFKDQSAINSAIRKALRENDPRIHEAAVAKNNGNLAEYTRIAKEIIGEKHFSQDDVVAAINAEINAMNKGETTSSAPKASGLYKTEDFAVAISNGDHAMANAIKTDIIQTAEKNGKTEKEAMESFVSSAKSKLKEMFLAGEVSGRQAIDALATYCDKTEEEAEEEISKWEFENQYGFSYSDKKEKFMAGEMSAQDLKRILMDVEGKTDKEASSYIVSYARDAYEEGYFGRSHAASIMASYGGLTAEEAENKLRYIDVKKQFSDTYVDDAWVDEYYQEIESSGISISVFIDYRNRVKSITGEGKKERRMAVIDSLPISSAQKDALYYAEGWAASKLYEAPWH